MNIFIGATLGTLFLSVLHVEMLPKAPKKSAYILQLELMLRDCKDTSECKAIENVIKRGAK